MVAGQTLLQALGFGFHFGRAGAEDILFHDTSQVAVQQARLHLFQFREPLAGLAKLLGANAFVVVTHRLKVVAEPLTAFIVGDAQFVHILLDGFLELVLPPADGWVVGIGLEVAASVVNVLVDVAVSHVSADAFTGDPVAAMSASEHAAGEVVVGLPHAMVLAFEQGLALFKQSQIDDRAMLAGIGLPTKGDHADVEAVVEDVGQGRAMEPGVIALIGVAFTLQDACQFLEGVHAGGVQLEDALDGRGVDGMGLDRLVPVIAHVLVSVGSQARCPSLSHFLLDALEHLMAQIVRVILGDGGHDVERERAGGTGAELIFDECQFHATLVFKLLQSHGVAHVAACPVELVGEDVLDLQFASTGSDPFEHLVESGTFRATFGGLGHDEFSHHLPSFALGLLTIDTQLRVDGVALTLFP